MTATIREVEPRVNQMVHLGWRFAVGRLQGSWSRAGGRLFDRKTPDINGAVRNSELCVTTHIPHYQSALWPCLGTLL